MAGLMKDVISVNRRSKAAIDFVADQPGLTLFHCHMQLHMDFGFMQLLNMRVSSDALVLFDIDGTLIRRAGRTTGKRWWRPSGALFAWRPPPKACRWPGCWIATFSEP